MPLREGYSKSAIGSNIGTEINAGRPRDQAIAIAFSKAREARRRKKLWMGGYADGGEAPGVGHDYQDDDLEGPPMPHLDTAGEPHTEDYNDEEQPMEYMAFGGNVPGESTQHVVPDMDPIARFHAALKRRRPRY